MTKSKKDKIRDITNRIYQRTTRRLKYSNASLEADFYLDEVMTEEQYRKAKDNLDTEYLKGIGKLPTFVLDYILEFHKTGEMRRAKKTLDFIHRVIAERVLLDETEGEN